MVFVAVFFQATPHVTVGLVAAIVFRSHMIIPLYAGATRLDMITAAAVTSGSLVQCLTVCGRPISISRQAVVWGRQGEDR